MITQDDNNNDNLEPNQDNDEGRVDSKDDIVSADLDELRTELQDYKEQLVRTRAEMENQRKRMEREIDRDRKFAIQDFVLKLLPVKDSLEKGLDMIDLSEDTNADPVIKGMDITLNLFNDVFRSVGLEEIYPVGEIYDPNMHEAMTMKYVEDKEPNVVLSVFQVGYALNGRLIRPARVEVSTSD